MTEIKTETEPETVPAGQIDSGARGSKSLKSRLNEDVYGSRTALRQAQATA